MPFKSSRKRVIIPTVEMTPMIDIVFLLIIFFMVAAQFAQQARVDLALPEEIGAQESNELLSVFIVNILSNGELVLDDSDGPITLLELNAILQNKKEAANGAHWNDIKIRADKGSQAKVLNDVINLLTENGLHETIIATEEP